jgi:hypothetical protein
MLKIIEDMPPGTIGFEASGKISDDDYRDVLVPAVRLLYVLADGTSYSPGAVWADTKLWAGNLRGWKRVAVVSDADWLENAVKAFGWMMPGEVKVFDDDDVDDAKKWLVGGEDTDDD